ncbi:MAG: hypothetical protein HC802_10960, partial [Caldilineaceae bacterium]|nr:hypothetical protein [Caldilineaceae bacterium]
AIAEYHRHRLKRSLGRRYQISPELDGGEFLRQLEQADHRLGDGDVERVARVLTTTEAEGSERNLVEMVDQIDRILEI